MKLLNLYGVQPRAKYKSYKGEVGKTCKNLLLTKVVDEENNKTYYERNFTTTGVNPIWSTDVSEFHIAAGKLYLSLIIDIHNREIVSYVISRRPDFKQVTTMLDIAFKKHKKLNGLIFHSDQGWQYQMKPYRDRLSKNGIKQSMSRKGNCYDNCVMEIFFGTMKNIFIHRWINSMNPTNCYNYCKLSVPYYSTAFVTFLLFVLRLKLTY